LTSKSSEVVDDSKYIRFKDSVKTYGFMIWVKYIVNVYMDLMMNAGTHI